MGFETSFIPLWLRSSNRVNLPRWGLKHIEKDNNSDEVICVNLPRWGLKRVLLGLMSIQTGRVNLPRWGLKLIAELITDDENDV